jgi:hypothetical protein
MILGAFQFLAFLQQRGHVRFLVFATVHGKAAGAVVCAQRDVGALLERGIHGLGNQRRQRFAVSLHEFVLFFAVEVHGTQVPADDGAAVRVRTSDSDGFAQQLVLRLNRLEDRRRQVAVNPDEIERDEQQRGTFRGGEDGRLGVKFGLRAFGGGGAGTVAGHPDFFLGCDRLRSEPRSPRRFLGEGEGSEDEQRQEREEVTHGKPSREQAR